MADPWDVVTLAEASRALRLGSTDTELLPELERVITSASRLLDRHYGPMVQRTVTESHNAGPSVALASYPVVSVTSVIVDGTTYGPAEYALERHGTQSFGELFRLSTGVRIPWLTPYFQGITVEYVAGRMSSTTDTSQVAAHCKQGCLLQLQHMWRPMQFGTGEVSEFDTAAVFQNTQGLARGLHEHFHGERRHGIA